MAKYHITPSGDPGKCSASPGNCPFIASELYYDSLKEALRRSSMQTVTTPSREKTLEEILRVAASRGFNYDEENIGDWDD